MALAPEDANGGSFHAVVRGQYVGSHRFSLHAQCVGFPSASLYGEAPRIPLPIEVNDAETRAPLAGAQVDPGRNHLQSTGPFDLDQVLRTVQGDRDTQFQVVPRGLGFDVQRLTIDPNLGIEAARRQGYDVRELDGRALAPENHVSLSRAPLDHHFNPRATDPQIPGREPIPVRRELGSEGGRAVWCVGLPP